MFTRLICAGRYFLLSIILQFTGVTLCYAYCDNNEYQGPYNHYIDFGNITIPGDLAVGDVITSTTVNPSNIHIGGCWAGTIPYTGIFIGPYATRISSMSGYIYSTNIPGVGIRAYAAYSSDLNVHFGEMKYAYPPVDWGLYDLFTVKFDLIKTGPISSGLLSPGEMSMMTADGVAFSSYTVTGGTITAPGCTVVTPSTSVTLGNHLTTEFYGPGSSTASTNVPVELNCPSGGIKVQATLNATADTSTALPGAIKLTPSSGLTATGVAVQMLDRNGNGLPVNGTTEYTSSVSGIMNLGWKARYIQTGATVTAGDANTSATVTLNYQ